MTPSDDQLTYIDEAIERAVRLLEKLRASLLEAEALMPVGPDRLAALNMDEQTALDAFLKRFLDAYEIGKSLFRSGLLLSNAGWAKLSYLDLVNEAELYGVLPSSAAWLDVRDARNSAAHEYAMRQEQQAALLTEAVKQGSVLLGQLDAAVATVVRLRSQVTRAQ